VRIARHSFYNLLGLGLPLLLALVSIPALLRLLGEERFGWLTLLWAVVSYIGLLDLGLSRALTQQLALALSRHLREEAGAILGTAVGLVATLGTAGGVLLALLSFGVPAWLPHAAEPERLVTALQWMALALPFTVLTAVLRGALEAAHAFAAINLIRLPLGLWTFAGPWLVAVVWGPDLAAIALALALGRIVGLAAHWVAVRRAMGGLAGRWRWVSARQSSLLQAGGWLTLANVVSPLMGYADRFFVGVSLSGAAAAYYAAPQEMVTKLWIIPGALTAVLLPAFAARGGARAAQAWQLFDRSLELLFLLLLPLTLGLALFARELLGVWLGAGFAVHSAPLLMLFAAGILVNCLAHVALTWLHGAGQFRAPALLQLVELPLFLALLWLLCARWGLIGAAVAWLTRMTVDAMCLFVLCRLQRGAWPPVPWMAAGWAGLLPFLLAGSASLEGRLLAWCLVAAVVVAVAWRRRAVLLAELGAPATLKGA
jgi:O-antigen/teichoic acid export membrane protein